MYAERKTFQEVQNIVRWDLQKSHLNVFPNGTTGVDIRDLLTYVFQQNNENGVQLARCTNCPYSEVLNSPPRNVILITSSKYKSVNSTFQKWQYNNEEVCPNCNHQLIKSRYSDTRNFLCFSFEVAVKISKKIKVVRENQRSFFTSTAWCDL